MSITTNNPNKAGTPTSTANEPRQIFVEVSSDAMSAKVTVLPPPSEVDKFATIDDVKAALTKQGVVYGINPNALAQIGAKLAEYASTKNIHEMTEGEVAAGMPVINGSDARIEYLYKKEDPSQEVQPGNGEGRIDYRAAHRIDNVAKGSLLARKIPVTIGQSGKTVTGVEIHAAEGKDINLIANKGVLINPANPNEYMADTEGQVIVKDGKISVQSIYEINGDVNLSTGNIEFVGTVIIKGDVKDGFKVNAGEDIIVNGVVEGADLKAGGNIVVNGGVSGNDKAHIICKGNAEIKYIRNATVQVGGNLSLSQAIMHSKVSCEGKIVISGQKGTIVGGQTIAGLEIEAALIGSNFGTQTELIVGEMVGLREELQRMETEIKELTLNMDKTKKGLAFLKDMHTKLGGNLPADKKEMLTKLSRVYFKLTADQKLLLEQKRELEMREKDAQNERPMSRVNCTGTIFPGAKIVINKVMRQISEELKFCTLTALAGEVKVGPLKTSSSTSKITPKVEKPENIKENIRYKSTTTE